MRKLSELSMPELCQSLDDILNKMDVPEARKSDMGWLLRNLAIRNSGHRDFQSAMTLIKFILKEEKE